MRPPEPRFQSENLAEFLRARRSPRRKSPGRCDTRSTPIPALSLSRGILQVPRVGVRDTNARRRAVHHWGRFRPSRYRRLRLAVVRQCRAGRIRAQGQMALSGDCVSAQAWEREADWVLAGPREWEVRAATAASAAVPAGRGSVRPPAVFAIAGFRLEVARLPARFGLVRVRQIRGPRLSRHRRRRLHRRLYPIQASARAGREAPRSQARLRSL